MSVNLLTKITSAAIALLLLVISFFILWAWKEIDKPYQINQSYHEIKSKLNTDIALSLEQYLGSGNTTKLAEAENKLEELKVARVYWLNSEQSDSVVQAINEVQLAIQEIRGAGKLAANPEILLINNEVERSGLISDIMKFTKKSDVSLEIKDKYKSILATTSQQLQQISILR